MMHCVVSLNDHTYVRDHMTDAQATRLQFCVRPNMRNHNTMKRDAIIKTLAGLVGQPHRVDLKNYDLLITVEIYKVGFSASATATASHRRRMLPHVVECYIAIIMLTVRRRTYAALVLWIIASRNLSDTTSLRFSTRRRRRRR